MSSEAVYAIREMKADESQDGYCPHGAARTLFSCRDQEVIISGPAETGKTLAALQKLDLLMWKYPRASGAIVRKTRASLTGSALETWENKVINQEVVRAVGGAHVEWYVYPNGSKVFVAGLDKADKLLSSERDIIYVNQCEEISLDDWEKMLSRVTGRAGNIPHPQLIGDCNPDKPTHWIRQRAASGKLTLLESRHEHNPTLFDQVTGEITDQGKRTLSVLDNLTGIRHKRLRLGLWAAAEGVVYEEWDRAVHLIDPFYIPDDWTRFRSIDFGYVNPFVCQWWALDPDGRMYLYREIYQTHRIVEDHARQILSYEEREVISATVADHDAEDNATLERHGVHTTNADKAVKPGIEAVQARLRKQGDGKPRLFVLRDCLVEVDDSLRDAKKPIRTEDEFDGYIWMTVTEGKTAKEAPKPVDDHGMDATRYAVMFADSYFGGETVDMKYARPNRELRKKGRAWM